MKRLMLIFSMLLISLNVYSKDLKFFPEGTFSEIMTKHYSEVLNLLDPVCLMDAECNTIRFSCMESMTRSYVIKITWTDDDANLEVFVESFPNQKERKIAFYKKEPVQKKEIDDFLKALKKKKFYEKPAEEMSNGYDGCDWLMETNIDGSYKVVCRWSPTSGFMYELGNILIDLSGERERFEMRQRKSRDWITGPYTEIFDKEDIRVFPCIRDVDGKLKFFLECFNVSENEIVIPRFYLSFVEEKSKLLKNDWFSVMDENGGFLKYNGLVLKVPARNLESDVVCLKPREYLKTAEIDVSYLLNKYGAQPSQKYYIFYNGPLGESRPIFMEYINDIDSSQYKLQRK